MAFIKEMHIFILATLSLLLIITGIFSYYYKFVIRGYGYLTSAYWCLDSLFILGVVLFPICFYRLDSMRKRLCLKVVICILLSYFLGTHVVYTQIVSLSYLSVYRIFRTGMNIMALSLCISLFPVDKKFKEFFRWLLLFTVLTIAIFLLACNRISIFNPYFYDFTQFKLVQSLLTYFIALIVYIANSIVCDSSEKTHMNQENSIKNSSYY